MRNIDGTVALNNYLQNTKRAASLHWQETFTGPRHDGRWTSRCKVNGEVLATGSGSQRTVARDEAARKALPILMAQDAAAQEAEPLVIIPQDAVVPQDLMPQDISSSPVIIEQDVEAPSSLIAQDVAAPEAETVTVSD